jgi:hypothetical protein
MEEGRGKKIAKLFGGLKKSSYFCRQLKGRRSQDWV